MTIETIWKIARFTPDESQEKAIRHTQGPLFLTAGPGSGKTAVLVWRTLNLIVFHGVKPDEIFLSTFTEKAAFQLRDRLRTQAKCSSSSSSMNTRTRILFWSVFSSSLQRDTRISVLSEATTRLSTDSVEQRWRTLSNSPIDANSNLESRQRASIWVLTIDQDKRSLVFMATSLDESIRRRRREKDITAFMTSRSTTSSVGPRVNLCYPAT